MMQEENVAIHTTYTEARANLASLLDRAANDRETVIISRRGADDVALIAADEFSSLQETAHLLRSPANAARLLSALGRALTNAEPPQTVEDLAREVGLAGEA
jgi:antitoxin YefM